MKAETAYNVIQALSPEEILRLYKMLGVSVSEKKKSKKKSKTNITVSHAIENLLSNNFNR